MATRIRAPRVRGVVALASALFAVLVLALAVALPEVSAQQAPAAQPAAPAAATPPGGPTSFDQATRQQTQPLNNAPVWRDVRSEKEHYTSTRGPEAGVLIQSGGETWRAYRNNYIVRYGGWALTIMVLVIALYYWRKGTIQLHEPLTGRKVQRFKTHERVIHWSTAISFVILAVSGLLMLFGKYILLPIIGPTLFAWLTQLGKNLHNFVGPVFVVCSVLLFATFVKDNLLKANDLTWLRKAGGLFSGEHVPTHRFNAGEKAWFWGGLSFLGIVVGVSGLVLDFPNFMQTRATMQFYHLVHAVGAILFMIGFLGHVYMGTIGVAGAFQAMRTGYVDETWMKEHHELLYQDIKSGKIAAEASAGSAATPSSAQVQH
jgi:formate dehydrogenase subunit gamma